MNKQLTPTTPHWLASNKSKASAEKLFLLYSPIWMAMMGLVMVTGWAASFTEFIYNGFSLFIVLPFVFLPLLFVEKKPTEKWFESYWFKANIYVGSFTFFGSYFGSEYFFDVLGMVYDYPMITESNLDSALVGSGEQRVPIAMYFLAHAYFMTYHTTAVVVLRRLKTSGLPSNNVLKKILWPVAIFVIAYFWAWMETKAMANPFIEQQFYYKDMAKMLAFGSIMYSFYFVSSFPIFYFLDENEAKPWTLWHTFMASCTAGLLTLYLLDFWTHIVGSIY